ncbi:MAG: acyl-CoA dehydrogenase family protein, partial [Pseudomonadota bacterium]
MVPQTIFTEDHDLFRRQVRRFMEEEVIPKTEKWEDQGYVDREAWLKAGELGFLCTTMPAEYGGAEADRLYATILIEEQAYAYSSGPGFSLHSDIVAPYILNYGSEEQKAHWLPKMARGEAIGAIAMTEPGAGSDLQGVRTSAVEDGDDYILNGSKIFITNGWHSDIVVVVAKTGEVSGGADQISLLLVEGDREGFRKGKPLKKVGLKAQDTCELFFDNVRVPKENLLGKQNGGFGMLMHELAWERLLIAITSVAACEKMFEDTLDYVRERKAFGKPVATFQNTRFSMAEMKTEIEIGRVFLDKCLELELQKKLTPETAAMAKYWLTDLQCKVADECVQLHGGYGYMWEYPVARAWADAR